MLGCGLSTPPKRPALRDVHAARLMVNDGICKRVAELKAAQSQKSELSRDQLWRNFLLK